MFIDSFSFRLSGKLILLIIILQDIPETTLLKMSFLRKFLTVSDTIDLNVLSKIWEQLVQLTITTNGLILVEFIS